jgi:RNA polymerase sigma-70 factor (ECF subfamily)
MGMLGDRFKSVLRGAKAGDRRSIAALYEDLAAAVLGYLRGQGAAEPEDMASEVFVSLIRGIRRFRGDEAAFRSWVFTIAHRRLIDERRRRARVRELPVDPMQIAVWWDDHVSTEGGLPSTLDRVHVGRALGRVTDDQRTVLLLRLVADLPIADTARIVGKSTGAVKTLQRRALAAMAREMWTEQVT